MEVGSCRLSKDFNLSRVVANMVSGQRVIAPEDMFAPQVRMHAALVHRCVGLEVLLDVQLVLLKGQFDVLRVSISCKDPIEVPSHSVLLVVETIVVGAADREDVLSHQLAKHAPIKNLMSIFDLVTYL